MAHIVDLSHRLFPGKQRFKLEIIRSSVEEYVPQYKVPEGEWYIMEDLEACTHVGTHVESPYHAVKDGKNVAEMDIRRLIGPAAIVDFTDKGFGDAMTRTEMIERGTHIQKEDIVLIKTGLSRYYGTAQYKRPYVETDAIEWLIDKNIKCLGIDCSGIENRTKGGHEVNHRMLFLNDIPLIEDMNNLDKLHAKRVFFIALPLPIEGLDASFIRPLAVEPMESVKAMINIFYSIDTVWDGID